MPDELCFVASVEERATLSRDGEDVAAVIPIEEFWFLERAIALLEDEIHLYQVAINHHNKNKNVGKAIPVKSRVSRLRPNYQLSIVNCQLLIDIRSYRRG